MMSILWSFFPQNNGVSNIQCYTVLHSISWVNKQPVYAFFADKTLRRCSTMSQDQELSIIFGVLRVLLTVLSTILSISGSKSSRFYDLEQLSICTYVQTNIHT